MFRITITPNGNYAMPIDLDSRNHVSDLQELMNDGYPIVLANELPDNMREFLEINHSSVMRADEED